MGTHQPLTTAQVTVLTLLKDLDELEDIKAVDKFCWDSVGINWDEETEIFATLEHYGYIDDERNLTLDGKQYLNLLKEYIQKVEDTKKSKKRERNINIILNANLSVINIDKIIEFFGSLIDVSKEVGKGKKIAEFIKTMLHK